MSRGMALGVRRAITRTALALALIGIAATDATLPANATPGFAGVPGTPALLEAFDAEGKVVDRASLESVPGRKAPGDPVPIFKMTVKASRIAYIQFSGPREGEYLAADEVRFIPVAGDRN